MTVPPPPAVPGELIEAAAAALRAALWGPYGVQPSNSSVAAVVVAAVYGDIVEAARRDALTAAAAAITSHAASHGGITFPEDFEAAARIVTDLIDGTAPRDGLSATHADPTPVPRIPGTDGAQKRSDAFGWGWVTQTMDAHADAARERMRKVQGLMHDGRVIAYEIASDEEPTDD